LVGKGEDVKYYQEIQHITDKQDQPEKLRQIEARLKADIPKQSQAVELMQSADADVSRNREMFENMRHVMKIWDCLLKSRLAVVELVLHRDDSSAKHANLADFLSADNGMIAAISKLTNTTAKSEPDYTERIKDDFIRHIHEEEKFLQRWSEVSNRLFPPVVK
jgi:hypothetical protein